MGGSYGLLSAQAGGFLGQPDGWRVGGGLLVNRATGEPLNDTLRNDFDLRTASFSLGYQLTPRWQVVARTAYDLRTFNARYFYTRSPADQSREQTRQAWQQVRLSHQGNRGRTELDLGYKMSQDSFLFNPAFPANVHRMHYLNAQLHHTRRLAPGLSLGLGGQADRRAIRSSDRGNHEDLHLGAYAMAYWQPSPGLNLTGSLRGDWDENYGFELLPQISFSYAAGALTLRGASGRSIRAGDYTERFISTQLPFVSSGRNLGNPDLLAERAWSHELGLDWNLVPGLQVRTTVFLRQGNNLIDYVPTPATDILRNDNLDPTGTYFFTQNISQLQTRGLEAELRAQRYLGGHWRLDAHAGYTFLQSRNDEPVVSKYLANHAGHLLTGYAALSRGRLRLALNGLWKVRAADQAAAINAELSPAYSVWNLRGAYHLLGDRLGLLLQVANLFDVQYQDILGAQMPGRWWMGGLSWCWE
ncbi:MAG: TonB-dependent receptor [Bacteroidetes bacterium]|nr:MAG: TonB-dependent receptor [Bacteroidota bacterium]